VVLAAAPFIPSIGGLKALGKAASHGDEIVKGAEAIASRGGIGFAKGLGQTALTPRRLQHASRHLIESGILSNWSKATGQRFVELATRILEKPTATFDHVLRGGQAVKGFLGKADGKDVVIFIFKEGKYAGEIATSIVPNPAQLAKWGFR
ncbi:hypothetical protein D6779_09590, partial [Candidatus Parcubacteria bacterium]